MAIFRSGQEVTAWTHSDLTASIGDSVTALSWQQPVRPTESLTSLASAQSARSLEVYWPPLSEQSSPNANFSETRLSDCEAGFQDLEEVAFLPETERDGHGRPFSGTMSSRILEPRDYGPFDFPNHCPKCSGEVAIACESKLLEWLRCRTVKLSSMTMKAGTSSQTTFRCLRLTGRFLNYKRPSAEADLHEVVRSSGKQRHEIVGERIRALYGHTTPTKIARTEVEPPGVLYHGTARRFCEAIMSQGLKLMARQYVHLSIDIDTAKRAGSRRDSSPVLLEVDAKRASADDLAFYQGNDKVWLADEIPPKYLKRIEQLLSSTGTIYSPEKSSTPHP